MITKIWLILANAHFEHSSTDQNLGNDTSRIVKFWMHSLRITFKLLFVSKNASPRRKLESLQFIQSHLTFYHNWKEIPESWVSKLSSFFWTKHLILLIFKDCVQCWKITWCILSCLMNAVCIKFYWTDVLRNGLVLNDFLLQFLFTLHDQAWLFLSYNKRITSNDFWHEYLYVFDERISRVGKCNRISKYRVYTGDLQRLVI